MQGECSVSFLVLIISFVYNAAVGSMTYKLSKMCRVSVVYLFQSQQCHVSHTLILSPKFKRSQITYLELVLAVVVFKYIMGRFCFVKEDVCCDNLEKKL